MASVQAYDSLKSAIQTGIAPVAVLDFDQIEASMEQSTTAFTVLEEAVEDEELVGFGGALCSREQGVILVHAFTPAPESSAASRALAETVQDLLRSQVLSNGLRIFAVDPPAPGSANNGLWTVYQVAVNYEFDTSRAHPAPLP